MGEFGALDLRLLGMLEDLRQTRSVSETARRFGMTQSGASRALARLRDVFDDPLFVLEAHRLEPTPRCDELVGDLSVCLSAARSLLERVPFEPSTAQGYVDLGMPDHYAHLFGPALLAALTKEAPGLDLVVRHFSPDWCRELRDGTVDLAFGVLRGDEAGLHRRWVLDDTWAVLLRRGHPALRGRWSAERFAEGRHGVMTVTGRGEAHVDRALAARGLSRRIAYRATSPLVVALAAVSSDLRVTTTSRLAKALAKRFPLVVKPLPVDAEPLRLPLVWHERMHHDAKHRWLRDLVTAVCAPSRSRRS